MGTLLLPRFFGLSGKEVTCFHHIDKEAILFWKRGKQDYESP